MAKNLQLLFCIYELMVARFGPSYQILPSTVCKL